MFGPIAQLATLVGTKFFFLLFFYHSFIIRGSRGE